jgi:hypothetical protein
MPSNEQRFSGGVAAGAMILIVGRSSGHPDRCK